MAAIPSEFLHGHPATAFTTHFEGSIFGYTAMREVRFADQKFPIELISAEKPSLYIGQHISLRGGKGYLPEGMDSKNYASVVAFNAPYQRVSDELVKVVELGTVNALHTRDIRPSNVGLVFMPEHPHGDPQVGSIRINQRDVEFLYVASEEPRNIHTMAIHYQDDGKDIVVKVGDLVRVNEGKPYPGFVTGFTVGYSLTGSPEILTRVAHEEGNFVVQALTDFHRAMPIEK